MADQLKNVFNPPFFESFIHSVKEIVPYFNKQHFLNHVFDTKWPERALKERINHIATAFYQELRDSYIERSKILLGIVDELDKKGTRGGLEHLFFPAIIEKYGLEEMDASLDAMERVTQFISCEFAVRPFLIADQEKIMKRMLKWSLHPHPHVRRFSSEGCRPRLPWAMAIPALKKDPSPIIPLLENLKNDDSLFVRKSVANNLNDIAKDHPRIVFELSGKWKGNSKNTDWIIRHGCRTLLKKADQHTYKLFGLDDNLPCSILQLKLDRKKLSIGDRLAFSFRFRVESEATSRMRLEYAVYYVKSNGQQSRKIFQLAEKSFNPGMTYSFNKEQRFEDFTTRKHYPGKHKLGILVNGKELASSEFTLTQ